MSLRRFGGFVGFAAVAALMPRLALALPSGATAMLEDGLTHPLNVSSHLIVLLALGLLVGQQGLRQPLAALAGLVLALLVGFYTTHVYATTGYPTVLLILAAIAGLLTAATVPQLWPNLFSNDGSNIGSRLWNGAIVVAVALAGLLIGFDSAAPRIFGISRAAEKYFQLGVFSSAVGMFLFACGLAFALRKPLKGTIVRIPGAWLAAIAIIVLTLQLTGAKGIV